MGESGMMGDEPIEETELVEVLPGCEKVAEVGDEVVVDEDEE